MYAPLAVGRPQDQAESLRLKNSYFREQPKEALDCKFIASIHQIVKAHMEEYNSRYKKDFESPGFHAPAARPHLPRSCGSGTREGLPHHEI